MTVPTAPLSGAPIAATRRLARNWGWYLALGVIAVIAGIGSLLMPGATLVALAVLFGAVMVADGVGAVVDAVSARHAGGGLRALIGILGVGAVILGFWSLLHIGVTVVTLGVLLAVWWIFAGVRELAVGLSASGMPGRGWVIAMGAIQLILGLVLVFWPGLSLATLATLAGVWLLMTGIVEIVIGWRLRSLSKALA